MSSQVPTLRTKRLTLRPITEEDEPALVAVLGDFEVARNLAFATHPFTSDDAAKFVCFVSRQQAQGSAANWAIEDGGLIGFVGCGKTPMHEDGDVEFGYFLARNKWGRGLITEAARAALDHVFATLGFERTAAGHAKDNLASARVLSKLGFKAAEEGEAFYRARGRNISRVRLRLDRADWVIKR